MVIAIAYAGILTLFLVWAVNKTAGMRPSEKSEMHGMDATYHGKHGYGMLNLN